MALLFISTGCGHSVPTVLGIPLPQASVITIRELKPTTKPVVVEGIMVEKCPVAGCWFYIQDKTGRVRVDTKSAGFVVTDVPLHTKVRVGGAFRNPGEPTVVATGLSY